MRFLIAVLLTAALSFIAGLYLPWWSIAVVSFLVGLLVSQRIAVGFLAGFTGIFILWSLLSFWMDWQNESILSHKVAQIFPLDGSSILLIIVTAFLGALVGGFSGMAGASLRPPPKI